jgi:thiamine pyrophosphate-dependent acetolactate synthase large subunit-like protein
MSTTVADQIAETLADVGVERVCGVVGDRLNGITDALHRQGRAVAGCMCGGSKSSVPGEKGW